MTQKTETKKYVESSPKLKRVKGDVAAHQARKKIEQWKEQREFDKQFEL
ncbi:MULTISPECIES: adenosine deaminase [Vibrio]|uniref:Adenosine deaminase n=1 Tax=Vibrio paucivorans TaxID=2829489 RepID=A0A9X3CHT6_9VIBR|nr:MULTISPECIES: adenosine deaminase [Vibrio]MCG9727866.1 adenosine deaminase [Vibrio brasiliensis]MCW8336113.1 adenosine deaminase [Vibrio paucivorans]